MKKNLIINFHVVNDAGWFENVVKLLKSKYALVDLSFFADRNNYKMKKGCCHITFDDGDKSFYTVVYPVLVKFNVPATLFVSPASATRRENFWFQEVKGYDKNAMKKILSRELLLPVETLAEMSYVSILKCLPLARIKEIIKKYQKETNTPPKPFMNMTAEEICEVEKSGLVTIGAHTLEHPILKNESDADCDKEITGSIKELQKILGHEVRYFAYPNGTPGEDFGEREFGFLEKNNIAVAVSTEPRFVSAKEHQLAMPRFGLSYGSMRFVKLKLMVGENWEKIKSLIRLSESKSRKNVAMLTEQIKKAQMAE